MTQWSMRQALFCLIGSTMLTLTLSVGGYSLWKNYWHERLHSEKYKITSIIQTSSEKEPLKTVYLAELLSLSIDRPSQLYAFNLKEGESKLLASPLISKAKIKRLPPSTLYIDYEVHKGVASLGDFKNTAVDEEGNLFPIAPFFTPKHLPEIYLGLSSFTGWHIEGPALDLALEILHYLKTAPWKEGVRIQRIDVSNAFAPSLGQREVVLFTEEELAVHKEGREIVCLFPKILRLAPKDYPQQLANFFVLKKAISEDYKRQIASLKEGGRFAPRIIDLRIPQLAFVEKS
jgi:hypothetical protein